MVRKPLTLDMLWFHAVSRLKAEVQQTYLSYLWWVLEPAFLIIAFYFVFEVLLQRGGPGFIYNLLVGVVVWTWFANAVSAASGSIFMASGLINQVNIDKALFPLSVVLTHTIKQAIVFGLLLVFLAFATGLQSSWSFLPALLITELLLILSVASLAAALLPFLPDLQYVISLLIRFFMFCSGVFFTVDMIDKRYQEYFLLNPMANLIDQYRAILLRGESPSWFSLFIICVCSLLIFWLAMTLIHRFAALYPRLAIR